MTIAPDEQQLAMEARELFEKYFASPYRDGRQVPVGPNPTNRGQALLRYDYLVRKGLIIQTSSPGTFRISDKGKDLAFREQAIDEALGIVGHMSRSDAGEGSAFDPGAVRARASAIFQEHFGACDRGRNVIPRGSLDMDACEELARRGLAKKVANGGPFMIGDRGIEVCMGEADLAQVLGLAPPPTPPPRLPMTLNVFQGPVAAVATAPGAVAHGIVNVRQVDEALRKTIELQDRLGELTDTLLPLLRRARKEERREATEAELLVQIADAKEFQDFEKAVKRGLPRNVVQTAVSVLELVPLLKAALSLLGGP